jgi:5'-3' exonuclease
VLLTRLYVDAPSLVYRAFFALPKTLTDPQGRPVNAVRGFIDMIARLLTDRRPRAVVTAFDADWRPAWRVRAYPGYKADRPEDPPELPPQFEVVAAVLDAAGIARAEASGYEADDVIAALVERKPPSERAAIVSGDRDLVALVRDPDVSLLYPARGVAGLEELDEAAVQTRYGVPPRLYPDLATLRGDPSDGLPGVAGIGPVRAARLLERFGSVEGILDNLDALPVRQARAFDAARSYLEAVRPVVRLVTDIEVITSAAHAPDEQRLRALGEERNLGSAPERLLRALETLGPRPP